MSLLEDKLDEVKNLYKEKYGEDVDSESNDEDGLLKMAALEDKLVESEAGDHVVGEEGAAWLCSINSEDNAVDEDGATWIRTIGTGLVPLSVLEKSDLDKSATIASDCLSDEIDEFEFVDDA
mmetsp:Transcript_145173/g.264129  ORF Transcript_145173/g.264129 Transcript_145173/m.264129 type:complete len:122 (-) Transcript_145173:138-503(-)